MYQLKFLKSPTSNNLTILLTSDVHNALDKINVLGEWLSQRKREIDFIICSGDLTNFDPANEHIPELVSACEGEMSSVISGLENVCGRVVYIPGNHDAKTTLVETQQSRLTMHSINLHYKCLRIAPDLVLVGLGGSLPGYKGDQQEWVGFPFQTEEQIKAALDTILRGPLAHSSSQGDCISEKDTVVLVSHVGPHDASTTVDQVIIDAEPIQSGSKALRSLLLEPAMQKRIMLNIHGHTHHALGMTRLGKMFILNPGSLRTGHFGILSLRKLPEGRWQINGAEFHRL
eukprot:Phypoly_transcript_14677.p1 GENE.Phypoly_transcript_14677~~Phypoly_transcript_14677.p1  ORF type:complete len:287 (+),score=22.88 Phypoly_transcript_14677:112-972(+)